MLCTKKTSTSHHITVVNNAFVCTQHIWNTVKETVLWEKCMNQVTKIWECFIWCALNKLVSICFTDWLQYVAALILLEITDSRQKTHLPGPNWTLFWVWSCWGFGQLSGPSDVCVWPQQPEQQQNRSLLSALQILLSLPSAAWSLSGESNMKGFSKRKMS